MNLFFFIHNLLECTLDTAHPTIPYQFVDFAFLYSKQQLLFYGIAAKINSTTPILKNFFIYVSRISLMHTAIKRRSFRFISLRSMLIAKIVCGELIKII